MEVSALIEVVGYVLTLEPSLFCRICREMAQHKKPSSAKKPHIWHISSRFLHLDAMTSENLRSFVDMLLCKRLCFGIKEGSLLHVAPSMGEKCQQNNIVTKNLS